MKRLATFLVLLAVVVPAGLALQAQESGPRRDAPTDAKLDELIKTLRSALEDAEGRPGRKPLRFETHLYDIQDLTYPIQDFPGDHINLLPSGGFGFGLFEGEDSEPLAFYEGDAIADMIRENVAPETWDELRSVDVQYRHPGILLLRHTPGVHAMVREMLAELRSRAAAQITIDVRLVRTRDAVLRSVLGAGDAYVLDDAAAGRLAAAVRDGKAEVVQQGSISCTNTQRVALNDYAQVSYLQDYDVEIAEGSAIGDPILQSLRDGYIADVRPVLAGDGDLMVMEVRLEASRLHRPIGRAQLPLGAIDTPTLEILKLRTTVAFPLGKTIVVGGALADGDDGALLLLLEPSVTRYGGR